MSKLLLIIFMSALAPLMASGQWSEDPAVNTQITDLPGEDVIPKVGIGPGGDYFIGYFSLEQGNYNIRLQRLDKDGNILWADDGIVISDHPSMSWLTDWDLTVDHDNHAILAWQDIRSGGQNNVVAYRVSPDGDLVWGDDGLMLSDSDNFDVAPVVTVTTDNHSVVAWQSEGEIIMQRIAPDGTKQWGDWGITLSGSNPLSWPQLLAVDDGQIIMKYYDDGGVPWSPIRLLMAQRFDTNGSAVWDNPTLIADDGSIQAWYQIVPMISDGNDGFYIAWHDFSQSGTAASAWVQHVNADGETQFVDNGVLVSNNIDYNQFYPSIAKPENDPNLYVFWREVTGNQNFWGIFGQKVLPDGSIAWGDQGKAIIPVSSQPVLPYDAQPAGDDILIFYTHGLTAVTSELRALRVDKEGDSVWDDEYVTISSANSSKGHLYISPFANGQWVLSWEGDRTGVNNIFAQNIQPDGSLGVVETFGSLSGHVEIEGHMADITEVTVSLGEHQAHPNDTGFYQIDGLPAGAYDVTAHHPYTETQVVENVVIEGGALTENVDFMLNMLRRDLQLMVVDTDGNSYASVDFFVEGPEGSYSESSGDDEYIYVLPNLPYGFYQGTATLLDGFAVLESETVLDAENNEMVFLFLEAGLQETELFAELNVYPNPTRDLFKIDLQQIAEAELMRVEVHNMYGARIIKKTIAAGAIHEFSLEDHKAGVYLVRVFVGERMGVERVVKW